MSTLKIHLSKYEQIEMRDPFRPHVSVSAAARQSVKRGMGVSVDLTEVPFRTMNLNS